MEHMSELRKLSDWLIIELNIDNNPLCATYTSNQRYIRYPENVYVLAEAHFASNAITYLDSDACAQSTVDVIR